MKTKKYYETKEFQQLNKEWEQKLKQSGFFDIEEPKRRHTNNIQKQEIDYCPKQENHFDLCREYLNSGKIKDKLTLSIFELYCQGLSNRDIESKLGFICSQKTVCNKINEVLEVING